MFELRSVSVCLGLFMRDDVVEVATRFRARFHG